MLEYFILGLAMFNLICVYGLWFTRPTDDEVKYYFIENTDREHTLDLLEVCDKITTDYYSAHVKDKVNLLLDELGLEYVASGTNYAELRKKGFNNENCNNTNTKQRKEK